MIMTMRMRLTKSLMKLEEQNSNTINNNMKRLTTDDVQDELCDTIKDDMEVETEANVYEPFDEYVKQVEMKPLDDTSAEVEMNVDGLVNSS